MEDFIIDGCNALFNFTAKDIKTETLLLKVDRVVTGMTKNKYFTGYEERLKDLIDKRENFVDKNDIATFGTASDKSEAKKAKQKLQNSMRGMCKWVNYVADGNRTWLQSTGFDLSKATRTNGVLKPIEQFTAENGMNAGEFNFSFKSQGAVMKNKMIDWVYGDTVPVDGVWQTVNTTRCRFTATAFTPGKVITFRVHVTGPRGQEAFSQPITTVVGFNQSKATKRKK